MTSGEFESFVIDNAKMGLSDDSYNVIGLCGESGEVAEWVKKAKLRGDPNFTEDMLLAELGDVLHYTVRIARNHGWTLEDVMEGNRIKLTSPDRKKREYNFS